MSVPKNLEKYRRERGLTQAELAERINIDRSYVSRWENGTSIPNVEMFKLIAKVLNVSMDELAKD